MTRVQLESPPRSWSEGKPNAIYVSKKSSMINSDVLLPAVKEEWLPIFIFTLTWFDNWRDYLRSIDCVLTRIYLSAHSPQSESEEVALRDAEDGKKEDKEHVHVAIEAAKEVDFSKDLDVLQDTSWISVELL